MTMPDGGASGKPELGAVDRLAMTAKTKELIAYQEWEINELRGRLAQGSSAYSELSRRNQAGSAAYAELRERCVASEAELAERSEELDALRAVFDQFGGAELVKTHEAHEKLAAQIADAEDARAAIRSEISELEQQRNWLETGGVQSEHPADDSIALQTEIRKHKARLSDMVKGGAAARGPQPLDSSGMTTAQRRAAARQLSNLGLRAFNAEADNVISGATARNLDASTSKLYRAADQIGKLLASIGEGISHEYVEERVRELDLAVRYEQAKALERELERERRAELREQAKAERELEAERARLEKERTHYENILEAMRAKDDLDGITRMEEKIGEVEKGIEDVDHRSANIRAGYVYVISNIGAFGEHIVKIGMTRRLDPMDRVRELGDASVPFWFDVHALFFSDDAVAVEAELHRRFAAQRVNRINLRREFFYATPHEVREALESITGDLISFHEEPAAEQYRQSQDLAGGGA